MRLVFAGTPDFAVPTLEAILKAGHEVALVLTQPDRPRGRGQKTSPSPVKAKAIEYGLPILEPVYFNEEVYSTLRGLDCELGVVIAYGRILKQAMLNAFPAGWLNVHASLLPAYRGPAPIHRAIIDGEKETGITIMQVSPGLDEGDMLLQGKMPIGLNDDAGFLHDNLARLGAHLLVDALARMEEGTLIPVAQDERLATYAPLLTREDEKIHWDQSNHVIHNRVRGMNPWPGVYTVDNGKSLKIRLGGLKDEYISLPRRGQPGEIVAIEREEVAVATGDGVFWLKEVQPAGSNRMTAGAYFRGRRVSTGHILGGGCAG